jgi:quercetin dioxygenase-like cupin family protein
MENNLFGHSKIMNFKNLVEYSKEGITSKRVMQKETGNISLFAFDRGQQLSEHTAPFDAMVQAIEGKAEISIASNKHLLEEGDSIIMPANIPHAVFAAERFKMLLTMIKS